MSRLRSYAPLRPSIPRVLSREVQSELAWRSENHCEVILDGVRCPRWAQEPHHVQKRSQGGPDTSDNVIAICRDHHERTNWPYKRGRLVIRPLGQGRFACALVTAPDKFQATRRADRMSRFVAVGLLVSLLAGCATTLEHPVTHERVTCYSPGAGIGATGSSGLADAVMVGVGVLADLWFVAVGRRQCVDRLKQMGYQEITPELPETPPAEDESGREPG